MIYSTDNSPARYYAAIVAARKGWEAANAALQADTVATAWDSWNRYGFLYGDAEPQRPSAEGRVLLAAERCASNDLFSAERTAAHRLGISHAEVASWSQDEM